MSQVEEAGSSAEYMKFEPSCHWTGYWPAERVGSERLSFFAKGLKEPVSIAQEDVGDVVKIKYLDKEYESDLCWNAGLRKGGERPGLRLACRVHFDC